MLRNHVGNVRLCLSALAATCAMLLLSAGSLLAATSAQQVYETPETRTTQSTLPPIPQVAGDHVPVPRGPVTSSTDGTPKVGGAVPTPPEGAVQTPPEGAVPGEVANAGSVPTAAAPAVHESGDTLPVTGLDLALILGAAAAAGGVGLALRRAAR